MNLSAGSRPSTNRALENWPSILKLRSRPLAEKDSYPPICHFLIASIGLISIMTLRIKLSWIQKTRTSSVKTKSASDFQNRNLYATAKPEAQQIMSDIELIIESPK